MKNYNTNYIMLKIFLCNYYLFFGKYIIALFFFLFIGDKESSECDIFTFSVLDTIGIV